MVVKSTEGPTTRPCRLRFVNNFQYPVDILWIDHEGTEKKYATVQPTGQFPQGTYTTHAWRIRESASGRLLGTYVGEEATVEMTPAAACLVHKGFSAGEAFGKIKYPASWGRFQQRGEAMGIPIRAFSMVSDRAVRRAEHILEQMLEHTPKPMLERLIANKADVAIIGQNQVTSDMPMHAFLKGQDCEFGVRNFDHGTRGVGGSWTVPTCSTGEENLTMEDDSHYPSENILVHEFAHSVMSIAMNEDQRQAVISAYFNARATNLYRSSCYMISNADEYWAEGTQSWFEATVRVDVNGGVNTRRRLRRHDPQLAALLQGAYGDGEWRFPDTAPVPFLLPGERSPNLMSHFRGRKSARYSLCCGSFPSLLFRLAAGNKPGTKTP